MSIKIKICGLTTEESMQSCINSGVEFAGFVFVDDSPRNIDIDMAKKLCEIASGKVTCVGLFQNATMTKIKNICDGVDLDIIQLHGAETPEYVLGIKQAFGKPVMKAISISTASDLEFARLYSDVADYILFDAKAPVDSSIQGGNGTSFDWSILKDFDMDSIVTVPWILAGGLNADNVTDAISITNAKIIDVSGGVEREKGIKDIEKITQFIKAVKSV